MSMPIFFMSTTMHTKKMDVDVNQNSLKTTTKKKAVVRAMISLYITVKEDKLREVEHSC